MECIFFSRTSGNFIYRLFNFLSAKRQLLPAYGNLDTECPWLFFVVVYLPLVLLQDTSLNDLLGTQWQFLFMHYSNEAFPKGAHILFFALTLHSWFKWSKLNDELIIRISCVVLGPKTKRAPLGVPRTEFGKPFSNVSFRHSLRWSW